MHPKPEEEAPLAPRPSIPNSDNEAPEVAVDTNLIQLDTLVFIISNCSCRSISLTIT